MADVLTSGSAADAGGDFRLLVGEGKPATFVLGSLGLGLCESQLELAADYRFDSIR